MQTAKDIIFKITPDVKKEIIKIIDERIREAHVTKEDFSELKEIIRNLGIKTTELAEAQKRTEQKVEELAEAQKRTEQRVEELAEAQKKTEQRVEELAEAQKKTEQRVEELAEAQKKTEQRVEELAEAQKKTEQRVEELAEAQKRTEKRLEELAEAQKRTEEALIELTKEHAVTRKMLGGLSDTVGYRLEDEAFKALPRLLEDHYGITVKGRIKRTFIKDNKGRDIEVNIFGEALKKNKIIIIIGESKSQLSKNDIDRFINRKLKPFKGVFEDIFPVIVTYMITEPDVEEYAKSKGISVFFSYDF
ncbi:MAG TPA: hypothetical protein PLM71_04465 [Syntrophorhabdaceae bacterium]|nr:hypothetical protein [Syntrophorhabdaceae bacterium]